MYCAHEIRTWSRLDAKCSSFVATICSFPAGFLTKPKICYLKIDASCARCHHLRMQNTQYRTSKVRYRLPRKSSLLKTLEKLLHLSQKTTCDTSSNCHEVACHTKQRYTQRYTPFRRALQRKRYCIMWSSLMTVADSKHTSIPRQQS